MKKNLQQWSIALIGLVVLAGGVVANLGLFGQVRAQNEFTYAGEVDAPDFPEGLAWLNVAEPLTMADLRGKIVLLDFWTYGCINCIHIIPQLKRLEAEYPNELVVIGVHSAKFEGESLTENIRQIVQRYGVVHPVVNDADFKIWQTYGVQAWPTVGLIDPQGKIVGGRSGEGIYDFFKPIIQTMAEEYAAAGILDLTPLPLAPEVASLDRSPLLFPGKVLVDEAGNRLFIADSGHHRIVVVRLDNFEVLQIIGSGEAGLQDGDFASARFDNPQGMELLGERLYVADVNNHAIRAVDLETQNVTRIAGTGKMATFLMEEGEALSLDLRSPWDVDEEGGILYIAMAGSHQLWQMDLATNRLAPFAGNAREDLIDGNRLEAELAQPSDVLSDGEYIYFADSESSAIRRAGIAAEGQVETVVGPVNQAQGRLFTFGDVDGGLDETRLQHPLGVTMAADGLLYIADTYNNKIKVVDPQAQTSFSFAGSVEGGYFDGTGTEALFDEPGGLDYSEGKLFVADTNNHAIRVIDLESKSVSTVVFPNVSQLLPTDVLADDAPLVSTEDLFAQAFGSDKTIVLEPQQVGAGEGVILVDALMPFGYKLNASAPFTALWNRDAVVAVNEDQLDYRVHTPDLPIQFPVTLKEGQTDLSVDLTIYWCESINETLCFVERGTVVLPITVTSSGSAPSTLHLDYTLIPPDISNLGN